MWTIINLNFISKYRLQNRVEQFGICKKDCPPTIQVLNKEDGKHLRHLVMQNFQAKIIHSSRLQITPTPCLSELHRHKTAGGALLVGRLGNWHKKEPPHPHPHCQQQVTVFTDLKPWLVGQLQTQINYLLQVGQGFESCIFVHCCYWSACVGSFYFLSLNYSTK